MGTSESALSQDVVFDILSSSRRRYVLYRLREAEGPVELTELAEQVAAWENDTETDQITEQERKRVYVSLYQTRWVIGWMGDTESTSGHLGLLAFDALLTLGIFTYALGGAQISAAGSNAATTWEMLFWEIPYVMYDFVVNGQPLARASFISTFFTSIWIWLYAIAGLAL